MSFSWSTISRPIVALSPMADMTDSPYCQIVKSIASPIVFREMVSSEAIVRENRKTWHMAEIHPSERPIIQQIFGADPSIMAKSAEIIEREFAPEGIDINMGCPVYKITSNFNGCALMKDPALAVAIVKAMKSAISVPLSVKMRAGWKDHTECVEFARRIEDAGADAISVHGRTKEQGYSGLARRDVVAEVKKNVTIPVLYNGDIYSAEDYRIALEETGCDGALIARGALGNPWVFRDIELMNQGQLFSQVSLEERANVMRAHLALHTAHYGTDSYRTFRKHISWYLKEIPYSKQIKTLLMQAQSAPEVDAILATLPQLDSRALTD